jgi:hypothetical protein
MRLRENMREPVRGMSKINPVCETPWAALMQGFLFPFFFNVGVWDDGEGTVLDWGPKRLSCHWGVASRRPRTESPEISHSGHQPQHKEARSLETQYKLKHLMLRLQNSRLRKMQKPGATEFLAPPLPYYVL